jgi:flagellin
LQKSLTRLSSGSRINRPADDAGGLAVSMKLNASINRLKGVNNNIQNAISFLEVQDGVLQGAADIMGRMGELKALSQDVLKNSSDKANYNAEFMSLQNQLYQIGKETFNGVSLFATSTTSNGNPNTTTGAVVFGGTDKQDNTVSIFTSELGAAGTKVSVNRTALLSAVTFTGGTAASALTAVAYGKGQSFAASLGTSAATLDLSDISSSFFTKALENIATLRAENGGTTSRLNFALEHANRTESNLEAANGRIVDVDIAAESTRLAKYNILVQASAAMLAQANMAPSSALLLLQ